MKHYPDNGLRLTGRGLMRPVEPMVMLRGRVYEGTNLQFRSNYYSVTGSDKPHFKGVTMYPCKFHANSDKPDDVSGTASFWVDGENFVIPLESFIDCQAISKMLQMAHDQGRSFAAYQMWDTVCKAAERRGDELGRLDYIRDQEV